MGTHGIGAKKETVTFLFIHYGTVKKARMIPAFLCSVAFNRFGVAILSSMRAQTRTPGLAVVLAHASAATISSELQIRYPPPQPEPTQNVHRPQRKPSSWIRFVECRRHRCPQTDHRTFFSTRTALNGSSWEPGAGATVAKKAEDLSPLAA